MKVLTFATMLSLLLVFPLFYIVADSASSQEPQQVESTEPERINPEWHVTEVLIRVHWMNGRAIRTEWNRQNPDDTSVEDDEFLYAWSSCDEPTDWESDVPYTECDMYASFPKFVDDELTCHIGHEAMHGFAGDYHGDQ
jgi:hypothetical protein